MELERGVAEKEQLEGIISRQQDMLTELEEEASDLRDRASSAEHELHSVAELVKKEDRFAELQEALSTILGMRTRWLFSWFRRTVWR